MTVISCRKIVSINYNIAILSDRFATLGSISVDRVNDDSHCYCTLL